MRNSMPDAVNNLPGVIRSAICQWSAANLLNLSEKQIQQATEGAVQAIAATGPNSCEALSPESAFWQSATGPLLHEEGRS